MKEYYVSIDVGGTALKYGIIDEHAQIIKKDSVQTNTAGKGEGILEQIVKSRWKNGFKYHVQWKMM